MKKSCHCYGNCRSDRGGRKDKLAALRNVPKKKLLGETAKVDKVLSKFKTHSIAMQRLMNCSMRSCCCYK